MIAIFKMEAIGDNFFAYRWYHRRINPAYERQVWQMTKPELEPWVDRIVGINGGALTRERVKGVRDYTRATGVGARGIYIWYHLRPGIYEINERVSWRKARRYFVEAANGMLTELTRDEVIKCLTNGTSESAS